MEYILVNDHPSSKFPWNTVEQVSVGLSFINVTGNATVTSSGVLPTFSRLNPPWALQS